MVSKSELSSFQWLKTSTFRVLHYGKRLLETIFIHRFSNATMPIMNLFKNCGYYWGFAGYIAYHINHPLYTTPGNTQVFSFLAAFLTCELGNFSIHMLLRNLRPPGSKVRKIPVPSSNPFTQLFNLVSCPNYTYEASTSSHYRYHYKTGVYSKLEIEGPLSPKLSSSCIGLCDTSLLI